MVSISIDNGRIMEYEIISQESTLKSSDNKLNFLVKIPKEVLTGTIYDIEIILEEP